MNMNMKILKNLKITTFIILAVYLLLQWLSTGLLEALLSSILLIGIGFKCIECFKNLKCNI